MELHLTSAEHTADLRRFLTRIAAAGQPETLLVARGSALAVYGCIAAPLGLLDQSPTVLVMRAMPLARPQRLNRVVEIRALHDRFARAEREAARLGRGGSTPETTPVLPLPPMQITAAWAGVQPPVTGWQPLGTVDNASLKAVADEGAARVQQALPRDSGAPLLEQVRHRVWHAEMFPGVPAYAAFALAATGLLPERGAARLSTAGGWHRLTTDIGHVLTRNVR